MTHSSASDIPCIDPPTGFTLDPGGRIAYGPRFGDVYSIWAPDRDVEVVVREDAAGGHSTTTARDLRDDLDPVVVTLGIPGVTA